MGDTNTGVYGTSSSGVGVRGTSTTSFGVEGTSTNSYGGTFASRQGIGMMAEQAFVLTATNSAQCLQVLRRGTNSSGKGYNYTGDLIYGNDSPSGSGGGATPTSSATSFDWTREA